MQGRLKVALGSTIVPIIFLIRAFVRYGEADSKHSQAEGDFQRALAQSQHQQQQAATQGSGRDTVGCVDWAMADCHPGDGNCDACMDALRGCLSKSTRNDAYCAAVPQYRVNLPPDDEAASTKWQKDQKEKYGLKHWSCSAMFKFVQLHCHPL
jgi:hypothetical protein